MFVLYQQLALLLVVPIDNMNLKCNVVMEAGACLCRQTGFQTAFPSKSMETRKNLTKFNGKND
tara:strand:- start:28651 stop:28839 length:189 start_codon:yes stop_codon:yes gene_type:complete